MKADEDGLGKKIRALFSGDIGDPAENRNVARLLNEELIPRLIGVLVRFGTDKVSAEEIAKEAVDRAVRTYEPGKARFLTFATTIALNIRVDRFRRGLLAGNPVSGLDESIAAHDPAFGASSDPGESEEESQFVNQVRPLFSRLSQKDRILIYLDIHGDPKESFTAIYGIGKGAYRQRKSRAYRRLRELYNKHYRGSGSDRRRRG